MSREILFKAWEELTLDRMSNIYPMIHATFENPDIEIDLRDVMSTFE